MEKLTFSKTINASRQTVWNILWSDTTYPEWTSAFCEGSHMITDLQKGSKVLFLDGKGSGMVSMVAEKREPEYLSFEHLGEVKNGIEDTESEQVKMWAGAHENYTLTETEGQTHLLVDLESVGMPDEFQDYFLKTWPVAMNKIKELSEEKG
ncbi:SRPBCC domain-containing protein [Mucilaginibacter terrae]|uniref:SRPBCC domain-containing protein n=1 Tax=Mucilaginibacter terrae TaxID=1955052 RepID=UPI00362E81A3